MNRPRMIVVAGPPGSGKSTLIPGAGFGVAWFNADDRAAELNGGSYRRIPREIRSRVNRDFESFVESQIRSRTSFAIETTLRSDATLRQARIAAAAGFEVMMNYVALDNVERNLKRVAARAEAGGHAASEVVLRAIHAASLANLPAALRELELVTVHDNSREHGELAEAMIAYRGRTVWLSPTPPAWLIQALRGTEFEIP